MAKNNKKNRFEQNQKVNLDLSDETKSFQERIDEVRSLVEENLRQTKALRQSSQGGSELKLQKDLQKLLQENLKISQELYEMTKKIKRWVAWQKVWGVIKILIIIIPIALGLIYLPPLLKEAVKPYQELLNFSNSNQDLMGQIKSLINVENKEHISP